MSAFSDSYVLRVLFAIPAPACGLDALARRWHRPRTSPFDPYRSQQHHMRGRWNTAEMRTAHYYRKQTQVFARMASSATDGESAERYRAFALDYLAKADKLEPSTGVVMALSNCDETRNDNHSGHELG
jgi:hypothetical protein